MIQTVVIKSGNCSDFFTSVERSGDNQDFSIGSLIAWALLMYMGADEENPWDEVAKMISVMSDTCAYELPEWAEAAKQQSRKMDEEIEE